MILNYLDKAFIRSINQKIVVIESDDWGALRAFKKVKGYEPKNIYDRLDFFETESDLNRLAKVLKKHKDANGRSSLITANVAVANPDIEKIIQSNFQSYHYETVIETFKKTQRTNTWEFWMHLVDEDLIKPQFHCREHINVNQFTEFFTSGIDDLTKTLFESYNFGFEVSGSFSKKNNFQVAWDYKSKDNEQQLILSILEGLKIFESIYQFKSKTVIAPSYTWNDTIERTLFKNGVTGMQGIRLRSLPSIDEHKSKLSQLRFMGYKRRTGIINLVRNVFFEPSHSSVFGANNALKRIDKLFMLRVPVVIGSHRVNFMSGGNLKNAEENCKALDYLISEIVKRHPNVVFMSSDELLNQFEKK